MSYSAAISRGSWRDPQKVYKKMPYSAAMAGALGGGFGANYIRYPSVPKINKIRKNTNKYNKIKKKSYFLSKQYTYLKRAKKILSDINIK